MDFVSPLIELFKNVWGLARQPLGYVCNPRGNVDSLGAATEELYRQQCDVETQVRAQENGRGVRRAEEVAGWLDQVRKFLYEVREVFEEAGECDRIGCLRRCHPRNCGSNYRLGKAVDKFLSEASILQQKKREFILLTLPLTPPTAIEMPVGDTMGLGTSLHQVWEWLVDERQGGVIGLYGLGGVGKTTLMKKINEKICRENHGFQVVIWVVVSRQVSEETIRDTIRKRLGIEDKIWNELPLEEMVWKLRQALTRKKFVLFIDDLWARLDLDKIGVPDELENGSKIVLTTRERQICAQMGAERTSFEVRCLTTVEALKLFEKNAGESTVKSHPVIQQLANQMAHECEGLPLALVTVGQAMAGITDLEVWDQELERLRRRPHTFTGMANKVYHVLESSYNRLDKSGRHCFLYCCLFPEDYRMRPQNLIGLWIGEGLLEGGHDVYRLWNDGKSILWEFNRACLLESGHDDYDEAYVKMHDVIRDMAIWIARDHGQNEQKWLVIERQEDLIISNWGDTEKVSIWGERIVNIDEIPPRCSQLKTLIVRETQVRLVQRGFFKLMAACLTVLDLSDNKNMKAFPEDICTLINLEYLNLSGTCIQELPWDINNLVRLRWLLLEFMKEDILIPREAITSLPLNVLSMWESCWLEKENEMKNKEKEKEKQKENMEKEMVEELGCMQNLVALSIRVCESRSVKEIFQSQNLHKSIRRAGIKKCSALKHIEVTHSLWHLEVLNLENCLELVEMNVNDGIDTCFPSLTEVRIVDCKLANLSWLVYAPKLQNLTVRGCPAMKKIIGDEFVPEDEFAPEELSAMRLFARLRSVALSELPKLESICNKVLSFPPGVKFQIAKCPGLRKLPLDSSSAWGGGFSVEGDKDWWPRFDWDPHARVAIKWGGRRNFVEEETTFQEARSIMDKEKLPGFEMRFLPHGPSGSA